MELSNLKNVKPGYVRPWAAGVHGRTASGQPPTVQGSRLGASTERCVVPVVNTQGPASKRTVPSHADHLAMRAKGGGGGGVHCAELGKRA